MRDSNFFHFLRCLQGLFLLILTGCGAKEPVRVDPAFYYWRSHFEVGRPEQYYLNKAGVGLLYVKFLDIDWDDTRNEPVPVATLTRDSGAFAAYEIIPCVFITNRTFARLAPDGLPLLARRIAGKIRDIAPEVRVKEIQIDCDWTQGTRAAYFGFLKTLRNQTKENGWAISATIRLHQWKYPDQTGVPPADKGALMFYNVGDLENWDEPNSILNLEKAREYLRGISPYPLHLDLALPVFRWGVLFRENKMIKLISGLGPESLADTVRFRKLEESRYEVKKSTYLNGYYLYAGDRIRLEAIDSTQLQAVIGEAGKKLDPVDRRLIFYHLDPANLTVLPYESLKDLATRLSAP